MLRTTTLLVAGLALLGCDDGKPEPANVRGCWGTGCAIITTSHYNQDFSGVGTLNAVQMSQQKVVTGIDPSLDPDTAVHVAGENNLYILNRTSGALRRYDFATLTVQQEIATGNAEAPNVTSAPIDFLRDDASTKIWVTLAGNDADHAVGVLDDSMPNVGVTKFVSVPADPSDSDGNPELSTLYSCKGTLYALAQGYTFAGSSVTYSPGRIAVIDEKTDTLQGFIALAGKNPGAIVAEGDDCTKVLVATSSDLSSVPDGTGGIERVDLAARTSSGFVSVDTDLGGRPFSLTRVSSSFWLVGMYFDPQPNAMGQIQLASAKVVAWNPSTHTVGGDVTGKAGFINFVDIGTDHQLYIGVGVFAGAADPTKLAQGLYVGKADGSLLSGAPIDLGDTPSAIAFQP
jgi:hypothetical protein